MIFECLFPETIYFPQLSNGTFKALEGEGGKLPPSRIIIKPPNSDS